MFKLTKIDLIKIKKLQYRSSFVVFLLAMLIPISATRLNSNFCV